MVHSVYGYGTGTERNPFGVGFGECLRIESIVPKEKFTGSAILDVGNVGVVRNIFNFDKIFF